MKEAAGIKRLLQEKGEEMDQTSENLQMDIVMREIFAIGDEVGFFRRRYHQYGSNTSFIINAFLLLFFTIAYCSCMSYYYLLF